MDICEKFLDDISLYIDNSLDRRSLKKLLAHVESCPDCKKTLEDLQMITDEMKQLDDVELPSHLHNQVMLKITNIADPIQLITKSAPKKRKFSAPIPIIRFDIRKTVLTCSAACCAVIALAFAFSGFAGYSPYVAEMAQAPALLSGRGNAEPAVSKLAEPEAFSFGADHADAGAAASKELLRDDIVNEGAASQTIESAQTVQDFTTKEFHIQIEVVDYEKAMEKINALEGFNSSINIRYADANEYQSAAIVKRVPADQYYSYRAQLRALGTVSYENEVQRQIAYQYLDDEARLKSKQVEAERLVSLLEKSQSLSVMVAIEKNLSVVEAEKNSYTSNLIRYDNQMGSPYLYIDIVQRRVSPPVNQIISLPQKMANAFKVSLNMIVSFLEFILILISGAFLPVFIFLLLIFVLFAVIRYANKSKRRDNHEK